MRDTFHECARCKQGCYPEFFNIEEGECNNCVIREVRFKNKKRNLKYFATEEGKAAKYRSWTSRRARVKGAKSDRWDRLEVFESANWKCHYCGITVVMPNR